MATQALQVMKATVENASYINPENFNGTDTLKGLGAEGGALWSRAQILFPNSQWDNQGRRIVFEDASEIAFVAVPSSLFETTYRAQ